jgi:hypothetical protein
MGAPAYQPVFGPGYGRVRLEIEPEAPGKTAYVLNLLKPTLDAKEALPPVRMIDTTDSFGAEILARGARYKVVFPKDSLDAPRLEVAR